MIKKTRGIYICPPSYREVVFSLFLLTVAVILAVIWRLGYIELSGWVQFYIGFAVTYTLLIMLLTFFIKEKKEKEEENEKSEAKE